MNGLTLRLIKVGSGKVKNTTGFSPVILPQQETCDETTQVYVQNFKNASTTESQLASLREYLTTKDLLVDDKLIDFLVAVFLYSEVKHPVKCFLTRHITRTKVLHEPFTKALAVEIKKFTNKQHKGYRPYVDEVTKLLCCTENFPPGADALIILEVQLVDYLTNSLDCSQKILWYGFSVLLASLFLSQKEEDWYQSKKESNSLSPTEKNEIFNLEHSILRLLLYLVQKTLDISKLNYKFNAIRLCIERLLFDVDVPMDTKSVGGIVYLTMHLLENGQDSWIDVLETPKTNPSLANLLTNESAKLSLSSAIATVVSADRLQAVVVGDENGVVKLTRYILSIGDRTSADSPFTLGVARAVGQISKQLDRLAGSSGINGGAVGDSGAASTGAVLAGLLLTHSWHQLEHHMDSVRHLSAQVLGCVVKYCVKLETNGDPKPLDEIVSWLRDMDRSRRSYAVVATILSRAAGPRLLQRCPELSPRLLSCLQLQPLHAAAASALETLLTQHMAVSSPDVIYKEWVLLILEHVTCQPVDSNVLNVFEHLLATAVKTDRHMIDYILPHIREASDPSSKHYNLKCVLMLLSVCRKSNVTGDVTSLTAGEWRGLISYEVLKLAAVNDVDETRILCLSLVVESWKSTEAYSRGELQLLLHYFYYNVNAQSPNFRQLTLSLIKKFIKRFEDSYKVLHRQKQPSDNENKCDFYLSFMDDLRKLCFDSLLVGANYSRRYVSLQTLVWCGRTDLPGYQMKWTEEHVERLLIHLEDSYENNKGFALEILEQCPQQLLKLKTYSISLEIEDIFKQASSVKPTDCVSAAYKLDLLKKKLPDKITEGKECEIPEYVSYCLISRLATVLETALCSEGTVLGVAAGGAGYGPLHCITHCLQRVQHQSISWCLAWTSLVSRLVSICERVSSSVAGVVNNESPEGHLPCDMNNVQIYDTGNSCGITLEDGRLVTAQMVLLCAWRSVKEVSLLLGEISSRLSIEGEGEASGNVRAGQLLGIGEHFTKLLAETKHRGAFEQAYVGFTMLLTRLWRCRSAELHSLPSRWLSELMATIASGAGTTTMCATRRSAGIPFLIQALVTTELQVHSNPKCFHQCMETLLQLAKSYPQQMQKNKENFQENSPNDMQISQELDPKVKEAMIETCTHSLNILRALFRNSALDESVSGYVGEGLMVAITGFEGETWGVRNSSTLLLSALLSRVFGVSRAPGGVGGLAGGHAGGRNRMTGRIFFLRYPLLYDFMLSKLEAMSSSPEVLRPALYPILLLLARLYPSALEGTVSNLKLVAFVPHVVSCGRSAVLKSRQLAARAVLPLIAPLQYISHIEDMFAIICDKSITKNYCHGILLQLINLLDSRPENITVDLEAKFRLYAHINTSLYILHQAVMHTYKPCYLLADEYVKMINLLILRFPELVTVETISDIEIHLEKLLFDNCNVVINSGRDVCLANSLYLYFVILNRTNIRKVPELVLKSLTHDSYDVILTCLNYLLILYGKLESASNTFEESLLIINNRRTIINELRKQLNYIPTLDSVFKTNTYLEVKQKSLKILTLEENTQRFIVNVKLSDENVTDEEVIGMLFDKIESEHENFVHIYLESCVKLVTKKLKEFSIGAGTVLSVIRVVFACSASDNDEKTREVALGFLENNISVLFSLNVESLGDEDAFEYKATIWSTIATLLEDDNETIRQRAANALRHVTDARTHVTDARTHVTDPRTHVTDARTHVTDARTHVTDARTHVTDARTHVTDARTHVTDARTHVTDARTHVTDARTHVADARTHVTDARTHVTDARTHVTDARTHVTDARTHVTDARTHVTDARTHVTDARTHVTDARTHVTDARTHVTDARTHVTDARTHVTDARTHVTDARTHVTDARTHVTDARTHVTDARTHVTPSRRAHELKRLLAESADVALCLVLALLDFKSEVCMTDEISDECRVFDQNERYNVLLEETIWTNDCADIIKQISKEKGLNAKEHVLSLIEHPVYRGTFEKLCNNLEIFKKMLLSDFKENRADALNPKLRLLAKKLTVT